MIRVHSALRTLGQKDKIVHCHPSWSLHSITERNKLMRRIIEEKATMRNGYWFKSTKEFMREINVKYSNLKTITKE